MLTGDLPTKDRTLTERERLQALVAEHDTGGRRPSGVAARVLFLLALAWPLYQLYVASPLPFVTGIGLIDDTQQRAIHLAFAVALGFLVFPAFARSPRRRIPLYDWALAILAASAALYILAFYGAINARAGGARTTVELAVSLLGMLCLLELTRRVLGPSLVIVALVFTAYVFLGPYMPEVISHRGFSLNRYVDHMWLTSEGVFGLPLGVSNSFIFLFVLFGALLDKAGAGNFFIKLSFALLGHLRGGPAKAAVVASGLTGLISGSAIANVVTTGTFTIPLMKRIGFSAEKAGAIEVSSSINGQIMPPVMGAAAFLMTEFVGISYFEVVKHAFVPAVISYIGLYYIVHLEAMKADMPVIAKLTQSTLLRRLVGFLIGFGGLVIACGLVYGGVAAIKAVAGPIAPAAAALAGLALYLLLLWIASRQPELEIDDPEAPLVSIPPVLPTLLAGAYFLLPIGVLVWCLMIERFSPGLSVSWAILVTVAVMLSRRPLIELMRGGKGSAAALRQGFRDLLQGLEAGSRNMIGIAIAMAAAGIIVGVVSLTGLGLVMTEVVDTVSGGNVVAMLFFTAVLCVVLGMGLPTTANYIVVASIMAQPLVTLAAQNGLVIPLFAVHLFVFYFGLISGTTPPVAVDAFAGAAVARSDPMRTCLQSFYYSLRTAILPFIFVFNPQILLIGVAGPLHATLVIATAIIAMLAFVAATQSWFLARSRRWESALLLLVALLLLHPGFWLNQITPPYVAEDPRNAAAVAEAAGDGALLRLVVSGENFSGDAVTLTVALPLGPADAAGAARLADSAGLVLETEGAEVWIAEVRPGSPAQRWGLSPGWQLLELQRPNRTIAKEWLFLPAAALLFLVVALQLRRRSRSRALP